MIVRGLDLSKVKQKAQEQRDSAPRLHLILDGDGHAYRCAAVVKRLDTAIRNLQQDILTAMLLAKCQTATVHFTHKTSDKAGRGRVKAAKPYQGNRKGKSKPPLLEPLRDAICLRENWLPEFTCVMHRDIEADDGMIIEAHAKPEFGIVRSDDKDLRCTPYGYYDIKTGIVQGPEPHGWFRLDYTDGGNVKPVGRGPIFFWAQMLYGDTADNVKGIEKYDGKLCGAAAALAVLGNVRDRDVAANLVIDGYRAIDQNVVAEASLLHLLQHPKDTATDYLLSHKLSEVNRKFVLDCDARDWKEAAKLPWED